MNPAKDSRYQNLLEVNLHQVRLFNSCRGISNRFSLIGSVGLWPRDSPWSIQRSLSSSFTRLDPKPMGRTLESKKKIVDELKELLGEAEMALVLDYKGLSIKEMSDLRNRLQSNNGVCKVTKNTLMRQAIDGDNTWSGLESLLSGANAFVLIKGDIGGSVKALQTFQKETKKSETKGGLFEGKLLSQEEIKAIASLPSKETLMAQLAGALNSIATKVAVGINEVPSGLARSLKQHSESSES